MSHKYTPPFGNLSLSTKRRGGGGAYTQDATISLAIMPSLPGMKSLSVGGGWGPSARQRNAPNASRRLTSFSVEGEGGGRFSEVAGASIVDAGGPC